MRNTCHRYRATILLLFAATVLQAGTITTTSLPEFLSHLQPGHQVQTFNGLAQGFTDTPLAFTSGIFGYSAATVSGFYNIDNGGGNILLSTVAPDVITFTFTSGNVTAVGGYFWSTDPDFNVWPGAVSVTLNDGTTLSEPNAGPGTFFGFYSDRAIESMTVTPASLTFDPATYPTVNDLYLGQTDTPEAVPEPAAITAVCGGLLTLMALRRRVRK